MEITRRRHAQSKFNIMSRLQREVSKQGAVFGVVLITHDANRLLRWFDIFMTKLLATIGVLFAFSFLPAIALEDFRKLDEQR